MATFTENYNLIKPSEEDFYDVTDFNENMDTIDTLMMTTEQSIDSVNEKIGIATDEGTETLFGKLNQINSAVGQGISLVKSIQRVLVNIDIKNKNVTKTINPVDTSRCFVIADHMSFETYEHSYSYTLNSDSLYVETASSSTCTINLSFWIIEFY